LDSFLKSYLVPSLVTVNNKYNPLPLFLIIQQEQQTIATENIIGPDLEDNQQQQPPATLIRRTLSKLFKQPVLAVGLVGRPLV